VATAFPLPGSGHAAVAVSAPGAGFGHWAGAPSAALDTDGTLLVAYRLRTARTRGAEIVVARSEDGEKLTTLTRIGRERLGAESLERPAIVRTWQGRWRLYVCCATPGSKHWWIDLLEADDPAALRTGRLATAGDMSAMDAVDPASRAATSTASPARRRRSQPWL
jgi:hypothetical protein